LRNKYAFGSLLVAYVADEEDEFMIVVMNAFLASLLLELLGKLGSV